jgi:hypothetical protein
MASTVDLYALEQAAGRKAAAAIRYQFKIGVKRTTKNPSANTLSATGSRAVFKDKRLQRVTMRAPHYIFKQHYGFEGVKSNGINMRLKNTSVLTYSLQNSRALETLVDTIADIRASQVIARINFIKYGK